MTVLQFKPRQDVRQSPRRLAHKPACSVVPITRNSYALYVAACAIDDKEPGRAAIMYRAVLVSHPKHAPSMVNLGNISFRKGDCKAAKALYRQAIEAQPSLPEAHYNLGYMALEYGELSDAVALLETAVALDPAFKDAHENLAHARKRLARAMAGASNRTT